MMMRWRLLFIPALVAAAKAATIDLLSGGQAQDFQAEVSRLMDIIISSIYSQKDVFLRELVSNAADALEKVRFLAVQDQSLLDVEPELRVRIELNPEEQTLTISDTGIGMSKDELIANLGTVARSGTTNFLEAVASGKADVNLIGQFGVGFYSAFLVADRVTVASKRADQDQQYVWQSNGVGFVVAEDPRGVTLTRGTEITLHLKDDATDFLLPVTVRDVVRRYNQFVQYPIFLAEEVENDADSSPTKENVDDDAADDDQSGLSSEDAEDIENAKKDAEKIDAESGKEDDTPVLTQKTIQWTQLNTEKPLWLRSKDEVTDEEYKEFFKSMTHGFEDPLTWIHFRAEGDVDFKALLYVPRRRRPDDPHGEQPLQRNVRIYARRVLVSDGLYEFLPSWLTFVHGVVDSDDLPLKVDRESLSQTRMLRAVSRKIVGKVLEALKRLSKEDSEAWAQFASEMEKKAAGEIEETPVRPYTQLGQLLDEFSKEIKYGCIVDDANRGKILKLLRFFTTRDGRDRKVSIDDVLQRQADGVSEVLYIASDSYDSAVASPHMQRFLRRGEEVIVLTDPFDEHCLRQFPDYSGKKFVSVEKTSPALSGDEKEQHKKISAVFKPLTSALRKALKARISNVAVSSKLESDAVALAAPQWGSSAYLDRLYASQAFGEAEAADLTKHRILEINPSHPLIKHLLAVVREDEEAAVGKIAPVALRLLDAAVINSGFHLQEPREMVGLVMRALAEDAGVSSDAKLEAYEITAEDEEMLAKKAEEKPERAGGMPNMQFMGADGQMDDDFDMERLMEMLKEQGPPGAQTGSAEHADDSDALLGDGGDFDADAFEETASLAKDEL